MPPTTPEAAKRKSTPLEGGVVAAMLSFWGVLFLFGPSYVESTGDWQVVTNVIGIALIGIGFAGALTEAGRLWSNEALTEWGVGAVFLVPAALLHIALQISGRSGAPTRVGRVAVLMLLALGVPFLFRGLAQALDPSTTVVAMSEEENRVRRLNTLKTLASAAIAVLSLLTVVLKFVLSL